MKKTRVLYVSQEITPFLPKNELSEVSRNLPQGIHEKGKEIRVFMPKYGSINERRHQLHEVIRLSGMNLVVNDTDHPLIIKVASIPTARMQVYFIDNEDYFNRKHVISDAKGVEFNDNDERAIFFSRGVVETVKKLRWSPDVVHCHGWLSALIPLYLRKIYYDDPLFADVKIVYSLYNNDFINPFRDTFSTKLMADGIEKEDIKHVEKPDFVNLTKLAMDNADGIVIGSNQINSDVEKYLKSLDKPVLEYQGDEDYVDAYNKFYDNLLQ